MDLRLLATVCGVLVIGGCGSRATTSGVGDAVGPSPSASKPAPCLTGPGVTTLFQDAGFGLAVAGDQAVIGTIHEIVRVPIAGGSPVSVASAEDPYGLLVMGDNVYFTGMHDSGPVDSQGKQPSATSLYVVPLAGGEPAILLSAAPNVDAWTTDGTSLFYSSYAWSVTKLTPPVTTTVDLPLVGKPIVNAIAVNGDYVYVATNDISSNDPKNGGIQRLPKAGGPPQVIVANIGHPWSLLADESSLYWVEDPPTGTFGDSHIVRAALDGTGITTLLPHGSRAMAITGDSLFFESDVIGRIPKTGGAVSIVASDQMGEDFLKVAGGNLVWVNHAQKALSDPTPTSINTACINGP